MRTMRSVRAMARIAFVALALGASIANVHAGEARLVHPVFQDHAVLQRDRPIRLWGQAPQGEQVAVSLAGRTTRVRADGDGRWEATLPPQAAGGPYELAVEAGASRQVLHDVQVGDVWLCSGQSNMELPLWRALDASSEIASAAHPRIRLFMVPKAAADLPAPGFEGEPRWEVASPDSAREFSAACFYFARELQKTVDVPMGLVQAAWGGSRIESWTSAEALRAGGDQDEALDVLALHATDPSAALARWGPSWERWWRSRDGVPPDDAPWRPDAPLAADWRVAPAELGAWERWGVPALAAYDGMLWYRTQVTLTAAQAARPAVLELGAIDETDMTWVNGVAVGSRYGPGSARRYPLPPGLLKAGANTVAINVLDTYRDGGLAGPASAHALRLDDGSRVILDAPWRYRPAPGGAAPPSAPWQAANGLATLYNGMIAPLGRLGLRGVLWYQGESNTGDGAAYATRLRALRADWRARFGDALPFLVVQLAGYGMPPVTPGESGWAEVREAQRRVVADDTASGLAVAIDIGDPYDIHPPNKQELGRRLARVARHVVYGERMPSPSGPVARAAWRVPGGVAVAFDGVTGGLAAKSADTPIGFELCGAAGAPCHYARATLAGDRVLLDASLEEAPRRVRYCWADGPVCTLHDSSGLPAGPFELPVSSAEVPR